MAYQRKTRDRWDIMTNYGYGWECENSEYTRADARRSLKEYRENCGGSVRLEKHREPIEGYEEKSQLKRESAGNYYIELDGCGVLGSHGFETLHFFRIDRTLWGACFGHGRQDHTATTLSALRSYYGL